MLEQKIGRHLGEGVLENVVSLYGSYLVTYAVPLVTIPYLVRTLGAAAWGLVAMAQGFGNYLNLVVEYGFNLSATREIARHRESPEYVRDLVAGVTGAKVTLCGFGVALAAILQHTVPALKENPAILWSGVLAGVALGLNPLWYFQGCERMRVVASLEVIAKTAAAAGIFVLVRHPVDAWRVLGLQAAASVLSTGIGLGMAYRDVGWRAPSVRAVTHALRSGWSMFLFRSSAMLYTTGNAFLLGLFAPPEAVGYFAGAEKISKAFMGLLNPFNQALYPRLTRLVKHKPEEAARLFRTNALVVGMGGIGLGAAVFAAAPLLVRILLGPQLMPAVPVLRALAILPPLIGINTVLSTQWMVPLGLDSMVNWIILSAGVLNVALATALAPRYQQMGMASAVISAELFVGIACGLVVLRRRAQPEQTNESLPSTDFA